MLINLFQHIKYTRMLKKIYKSENIIDNLSKLFNTEFRLDWVGRLYVILNPYIKDGKYDPTAATIQYDEHGANDNLFIENWIMERMVIAQQFIRASNLFDMLTYEIKPLGSGNYLFIIKPITYNDYIKSIKLIGIISISVICLGLLLWGLNIDEYFNILMSNNF